MKRILIAICVLLAIAGGAVAWKLRPERIPLVTDAGTIREPTATATIREILWQPPTLLAAVLNTAADEYEPRVSADGRTLYFVRGKPGSNADIFCCGRTRAGWSDPAPVAVINSEFDDLGPEPSPDGAAIYFYSDRPGGSGGYDLWMSRLGEDGWQPPVNLGAGVNSPYNDYGPAISPDGRTICFASNRPAAPSDAPKEGAWQATLREDLYQRDYDLFTATIGEAGVGGVQALTAINSTANEGSPAFSPAGDFLYFSSDRPGGAGGFDLFRARLIAGKFDAPKGLGREVNTPANELDPAMAMGGYALHFSSDRPAKTGAASAAGYDLYQTHSREVYRDVEVRQPSFNWAALWAQIRSSLLWAILALIVSLLLITLLRDLRGGRLSLLGKCLLASLLIHMLLMLLFNVVQVSTAIAGALRRSDRIRISLASVVRADDLTTQIRGSLTDAPAVEMPDAPAPVRIDPPREAPRLLLALLPVDSMRSPVERLAIQADAREAPTPDAEFTPTQPSPPPPARNEAVPDTPDEIVRDAADETPVSLELDRTTPVESPRARIQIATTRPVSESIARLSPESINMAPAIRGATLATETPSDPTPRFTAMPQSIPNLEGAAAPALLEVGLATPMEAANAAPAPERDAAIRVDTRRLAPPRASPRIGREPSPAAVSVTLLQPEPSKSESPDVSMAARSEQPADAPRAPAPITAAAPAPEATEWTARETLIDAPRSEAQPTSTAESAIASSEPTHRPTPAPPRAAPGVGATMTSARDAPLVELNPENRITIDRPSPLATFAGVMVDSEPRAGIPPHALPANEPLSAPAAVSMIDLALPQEVEPPAPMKQATAPEAGIIGRPIAGSPEGEAPVAVGTIVGRVVDAKTGQPLHGAEIRLDIPDTPPIIAVTARSGRYELHAPRMPDFFAVSASKGGYTPQTANASSQRMRGRKLDLDFALQPVSEQVVALEEEPSVHHLGNDLFEGRINSQFQRESEGRFLAATFPLTARQLTPHYRSARIELMTKGVQCPHKVRVNGHLLPERLAESPRDGSFGEIRIEFDPTILKEGDNAIVIRAVSCRGDLDDFEFVNVRIRLNP